MIIDFPKVDPELKAIGRRMRAWRSARELSCETLAARTGIRPELLVQAEAGQVRLKAHQLYAVTMQLSIPMRLLFEDVSPKNDKPRQSS